MIAMTEATSVVGLTSGNVILQNCFQPVAPSTCAAS